MFVIRNKKIFLGLSSFFVAVALTSIIVFGLPLGIEFKGGSQMEFSYSSTRPDIDLVTKAVKELNIGEVSIWPTGENNVLIKSRDLTQEERANLNLSLGTLGEGNEESYTSIGPSVGAELKKKAIYAIGISLLVIILFVAYAFRKVSQPVSSWKYSLAVILSLIHDIIIVTGAFAIIAQFSGAEVDTLFIVALLTTLSLSISDTIVVFDRVRENLGIANDDNEILDFDRIVGDSLSQTFARSVNTSLMVLVMVISLAVFGPKSTRLFSTILAIGMFFGIYSSIFLASPLLVVFGQLQKKK